MPFCMKFLTHEQILAQACDLANQFAAAEIEDATEQLRTLEHQRIAAHKRLHAITDYIAASGAHAPATLLKRDPVPGEFDSLPGYGYSQGPAAPAWCTISPP